MKPAAVVLLVNKKKYLNLCTRFLLISDFRKNKGLRTSGVSVAAWGGETGAGGRRGVRPRGRDTVTPEKICFNLSSEIVSSLRPIWIFKYLSRLSITLSGSRCNGDKGGEEPSSRGSTDLNEGVDLARTRVVRNNKREYLLWNSESCQVAQGTKGNRNGG